MLVLLDAISDGLCFVWSHVRFLVLVSLTTISLYGGGIWAEASCDEGANFVYAFSHCIFVCVCVGDVAPLRMEQSAENQATTCSACKDVGRRSPPRVPLGPCMSGQCCRDNYWNYPKLRCRKDPSLFRCKSGPAVADSPRLMSEACSSCATLMRRDQY